MSKPVSTRYVRSPEVSWAIDLVFSVGLLLDDFVCVMGVNFEERGSMQQSMESPHEQTESDGGPGIARGD